MERIGTLAMEFAEHIVAKYGPDAAIGAVMIVADVTDTAARNPILIASSDPRRWVQCALLAEASEVAESHNEERIHEADTEKD